MYGTDPLKNHVRRLFPESGRDQESEISLKSPKPVVASKISVRPGYSQTSRAGELGGNRRSTLNGGPYRIDRKSTRLNSSHVAISYAVFCLKKKKYEN